MEPGVNHAREKTRVCGMRLLGLVGVVAATVGGCQVNPQPVGGSAITASYEFGTLRAELPPRVSVMAAMASAETALRDRGYVIAARTATEDRGRVRGKAAAAGCLDAVVVQAMHSAHGTRVSVFVEPLGDEVESRVVMEAIVARLGPAVGGRGDAR